MTILALCLAFLFPGFSSPANPSSDALVTMDSLYLDGEYWHITGQQTQAGHTNAQLRNIERAPAHEKERLFREGFELSILEIDTLYSTIDRRAASTTSGYEIDLAAYGSVTNRHMYLPINALYAYISPCADEDAEAYSISRSLPVNEKNITVIAIPDGYEIQSLPAIKEIKEERYGRLTMQIEVLDRAVRITRALELPALQAETEAGSELCLFNDLLELADSGMIILKKS